MSQRGFYRPERPGEAWVGDVIPWQEDGEFHLFYLYETRQVPATGMPWHRVVTTDFIDFTETGEAIGSAGRDADDFNIYTGSIVRDDSGVHHAFYTGQNPEHLGRDGRPLQLVLHATSSDGMRTWERHPGDTFGATPGYETGDWRDPFVFRDDEAGLWRMLITARHAQGAPRRRGTIAQCVSTDLSSWEPVAPFWDPRRYLAHECPEVFEWNGWWYLVFSEFSDAFATRYRMSRSLHGPWLVPQHDTLDGRAFYAAKSAERDGRRLFFGWIASREGSSDDGPWQWAGTLSVLEADQREDGTLGFHPTRELRQSFGVGSALLPGGTILDARDGYATALAGSEPDGAVRIVAVLDIEEGTSECGLLLRTSEDGDEGYALRLEPKRERLVFDRWPRLHTGSEQWQISGDVPFELELERPCRLEPGEHLLEVILDGDICVATLDDAVTMSTRLYDRPSGRLGVFVGEGTVTITDLSVFTRDEREPLISESRDALSAAR